MKLMTSKVVAGASALLMAAALVQTAWADGPGAQSGRGDQSRRDREGPQRGAVHGPLWREAQPRPPAPRLVSPGVVFDERFHHDHYYPARGQSFVSLPGGSVSVHFGDASYFFQGGVWFKPFGARYVVIVPPVGIVVPMLPVAFTTLWVSGVPYFYANGVYYTAAQSGDGYVVVAPPAGVDTAQPAAAPATGALPDPVIYPRNGQSAAQTEADRRACNDWARSQPQASSDVGVYQRGMEACMDARGYTLR